jgi:hypothetical protein
VAPFKDFGWVAPSVFGGWHRFKLLKSKVP